MPTRTSPVLEARRLANYISCLGDFVVQPKYGAGYNHMGAVICDAILQAGLNYRTVVFPRVQRLMCRWPAACRTSRFAAMTNRYGLQEVLAWRDQEKPRRIAELTRLLVSESIEVEDDLCCWLQTRNHVDLLLSVKGVGPKTVDYLKGLVGLPAVAVDRHLRAFVALAGVSATTYEEIRSLICAAADVLGHDPSSLDYAIWSYMSQSRAPAKHRMVA